MAGSATGNEDDFQDIAGAVSKYYTVPAHFADSYFTGSNLHSVELYFRCMLGNPAGTVPTYHYAFHILFINTSTASYGTDAKGVRYLAIGRGSGGQTVAQGSTDTIKIALLHLGQSADWKGNYECSEDF